MTRYTDWIEYKPGDPIPEGRGQVRFVDDWECWDAPFSKWDWDEAGDGTITHYRRVIEEGDGTITHAELREVVEDLEGLARATACPKQKGALTYATMAFRSAFPHAFKEGERC